MKTTLTVILLTLFSFGAFAALKTGDEIILKQDLIMNSGQNLFVKVGPEGRCFLNVPAGHDIDFTIDTRLTVSDIYTHVIDEEGGKKAVSGIIMKGPQNEQVELTCLTERAFRTKKIALKHEINIIKEIESYDEVFSVSENQADQDIVEDERE